MTEGLVGAIIGGLLVLAGEVLARSAERRAEARKELRAAAADLAATYGIGVSRMRAARTEGGGTRPSSELLSYPDRQRAWSRLFTVPGSERLLAP